MPFHHQPPLGLTRPTALADLEQLGWNNPESLDLLWTLASGDPDLTLNTLIRIYEAAPELDAELRADEALRVRTLALLGASSAFGDHLAANPHLWSELAKPLPTPTEMLQEMLGCVSATPAEFAQSEDSAESTGSESESTPILLLPTSARWAPTGPRKGTTKPPSNPRIARS